MAKPKQGGKAGRRGRPALPKGAGKRHALGLRVTAERRKALEEAATSSGRSISQEMEFRLEQSFHEDTAFGGREMAGLFQMMAGAAALICERRGVNTWSSDWETFLAIRAAWHELIDQAIPAMPMEWKAKFQALREKFQALRNEAFHHLPSTPQSTGAMGGLLEDNLSSLDADSRQGHGGIEEWQYRARTYSEELHNALCHFLELESIGRDGSALARGLRLEASLTHEDR